MDLEKLKRVYDAARVLRGHTQQDAAEVVGKSQSTINRVLSDDITSQPTIDAILIYCDKAGLNQNIKKLGLDPHSKVRSLTPQD